MVDFTLTDEQKDLRELAHNFAEKEMRSVAWEYDKDGTWPQDVIDKAWEVGLMNTHVPEAYGGPGLDYLSGCLIEEEMGWGCSGIGTSLMANGLASAPITLGGSEETKKKYLGMLTESPKLASFCLTEPDAGSDVSGMKTKAVKKGDKYVISGSKCFITNGTYADYFTVYAKTDPEAGHRGISAFVVDADLPGVSVDKKEDKMGQRASNTATISFDEVEIPAENLLGEENKGFKLAMMTLDRTRPGVSAMAVGIGRAALEYATEYSKERVQFGVPIAMHQAIQFMIADMATKVEAGRLLVWSSAVMLDQGVRNSKVSSMAKRFAADSAMEITIDAVQVYGGYGFIKEYPVEKLMRDAKIMQLYEGTSQIQRLVIAKEVLLPRSRRRENSRGGSRRPRPPRTVSPSRQRLPSSPMDVSERAAAGKAARSEAPRSSHAEWEPPADRADPVAILERQARSRVPELVPIRYGRMVVSPFTFYRGAAAVMAADLARTPVSGLQGAGLRRRPPLQLRRLRRTGSPSRLRPQRLRRVAAWAVGVGRQAPRRQLRDRRPRKRAQAQASARRSLLDGRSHLPRGDARLSPGMRNLEVWYARLDVDAALAEVEHEDPIELKRVRKGAAKARAKDSLRALARLTENVDGELRFRQRTAAARARRGALAGRRRSLDRRGARGRARGLPGDPPGRPPAPARWLPFPPDRPQGRRRRQRRHPRLGRPADRRRRRRPALPAGEGGRGLGAGALRRRQPLQEPRAAGGRGPAPDAGRQRHLPRLVPGGRPRRS